MLCDICGEERALHHLGVYCPTTDEGDVLRYVSSDHPEGGRDPFDRFRPMWPKYVNVYHVVQCHGGSEEGGWWYDAGDPMESVRVDSQQEKDAVFEKLCGRYALELDGQTYALIGQRDNPDYERERSYGRRSAAGGYDIHISVESEFAQPYPEETPSYE